MENNMIELIETYFRSNHVKEFLTNYNMITSRNPKSHYFNSFGINFKGGKMVSVKFYAHLFPDLTQEDILKFLPTSDDYFRFILNKNKEDKKFDASSQGVAMELKFKEGQEKPVTGFFYNLDNSESSYDLIGFPDSLPQEFQSKCMSIGINFEYEKNNTLFKRYYYFNQPSEINYFAKRFAIDLKEANIVEFAESISNSKINVLSNTTNFSKIQGETNVFEDNEEALIKKILKKFDLDNIVFGIYENKSTRVIYFFETPQNIVNSEYSNVNTIQRVIDSL